jgi:hypothetical protein
MLARDKRHPSRGGDIITSLSKGGSSPTLPALARGSAIRISRPDPGAPAADPHHERTPSQQQVRDDRAEQQRQVQGTYRDSAAPSPPTRRRRPFLSWPGLTQAGQDRNLETEGLRSSRLQRAAFLQHRIGPVQSSRDAARRDTAAVGGA